MGSIILLIAFIVEAAFVTYSIVTRSDQKTVRSYLRIAALAVFVLLTLVSIIQWSFRWYLLTALLFVWAATRHELRPRRRRRPMCPPVQ